MSRVDGVRAALRRRIGARADIVRFYAGRDGRYHLEVAHWTRNIQAHSITDFSLV